LSAERQQRLQNLPGWAMDARSARWEEGFQRLQEYVKINGSSRLPSKYVFKGYKLGVWVNTQRQNWSSLSEQRRKRLMTLPDWTENTRNALWEEGFNHLLRYVADNGDALVPSTCILDGYRLGQWVAVQRSSWESLSDERRQRLQQLPGWAVSARAAWWEEGFRRCRRLSPGELGRQPATDQRQGDTRPRPAGKTPEATRVGVDSQRHSMGGQLSWT
jgi:Helicase associated domain